jgi:DNA-binding HxlR family transcriptional regulator
VLTEACPTRQIVNQIGDRWSMLVLYALEGGTLRFAELRRAVEGVTQKMLTHTLRLLERDGLVRREVFATVPLCVDYSLTRLGRGLSVRIAGIREWAYANMAGMGAPAATSTRRARQPLTLAPTGESCAPGCFRGRP